MILSYNYIDDNLSIVENTNLLKKANKDFLTDCFNRQYFHQFMSDIKGVNSIGIAMLDLNNLKHVNDTLGHKEGDKLIVDFSNYLKNKFKLSKVFRMGGDEFVIVLSNILENDFIDLMNDFKNELTNNKLAAIGYGYYTSFDNYIDILNECDFKMYDHKKQIKG